NECFSGIVFDLLSSMQFHEDHICQGTHTHIAPCLTVIVIFRQHQIPSASNRAVIELAYTLNRQIQVLTLLRHMINSWLIVQKDLDLSNHTIVHDAQVFLPYAFAHLGHPFFLEGSYSLSLDENLIRNRRKSHDSPRSTVVLGFF